METENWPDPVPEKLPKAMVNQALEIRHEIHQSVVKTVSEEQILQAKYGP